MYIRQSILLNWCIYGEDDRSLCGPKWETNVSVHSYSIMMPLMEKSFCSSVPFGTTVTTILDLSFSPILARFSLMGNRTVVSRCITSPGTMFMECGRLWKEPTNSAMLIGVVSSASGRLMNTSKWIACRDQR